VELNRVWLPSQPVFHGDIVRTRMRLFANPHASLNALLQYNRATELVSANVRFRYNVTDEKTCMSSTATGVMTRRMVFSGCQAR
jgi:hypothetical protein